MGVPFRIVLYAPDESHARTAADAAFARVAELNAILSDYDTDSELSRLSRSSEQRLTVPVGPDLWTVLEVSQKLSAKTGGAFDVTVGPMVNLWRKARREKQLPRPDLLQAAQARVGWQKLQLAPAQRTATLTVPDMRLDLGAIAKGYAVDEAMAILRRQGIEQALVSGGGDLAVSAAPPGKKGWRVELAPIDVTNAPPAEFVVLQNAALATSGDVFQHVEIGGRRYSHIVDPRTGIGLTDRSLVTVIARDCMTADSLATSVSVLGPGEGLRLLRQFPDAEARIVRAPDGQVEIRQSRRFSKYLEQE